MACLCIQANLMLPLLRTSKRYYHCNPAEKITMMRNICERLRQYFHCHSNRLLPLNHIIATEQFSLKGNYFAGAKGNRNIAGEKDANRLAFFESGDISGEIDLKSGLSRNYHSKKGMDLNRFPELISACTHNDFGNGMPITRYLAFGTSKQGEVKHHRRWTNSDGIAVKVEYELQPVLLFPYTVEYFIQNDGSIKVTAPPWIWPEGICRNAPALAIACSCRLCTTVVLPTGRGPLGKITATGTAAYTGLYAIMFQTSSRIIISAQGKWL